VYFNPSGGNKEVSMLHRWRLFFLLLCCVLGSVGIAKAQVAYGTPFANSITYQNVGTATAQVQFRFQNARTGDSIVVTRLLEAGAGSSLFVGGLAGNEQLPSGFHGSMRLSSTQPLVATVAYIAQPSATSPIRNRPLANAFLTTNSTVNIASLLKNYFNTTSILIVQNVEAVTADLTLKIYNADNPSAAPIIVTAEGVAAGGSYYWDMGTLFAVPSTFNGSGVVTALKTGSSQPANIIASLLELQTNGVGAIAYEGVLYPARTMYMATALCNVFGGQNTSYAVQNTDLATSTTVTVQYSNGSTDVRTLAPGAKSSFNACAAPGIAAGFSGSAKVTSDTTDIVVIGKVHGGGRLTGFVGESSGGSKLALPFVRYSSDALFATGNRQRTFIAIQNVASSAVNNVVVEYRDVTGALVGTHTIASIAAGAKANTNATLATPAPGKTAADLLDFGNPESNPPTSTGARVFGGAAIVVGSAGSQLIAVARVETVDTFRSVTVAEDYNGLAIQ
jgi:hypothetical protein